MRQAALTALALTLALAGCGGGDEEAAPTTTAPPEPALATNEELVAAVAGVTPEEVTCEAAAAATGTTGAAGATTSTTTTTTTTTTTAATTTTTTTTEEEPGAASCEADGTEYVVGDAENPVELDTLTAELDSVEALEEASGEYLDPRPAKNGVFLLAELTVVNSDFLPAKFDDLGDQVLLKVGQATFREPFNVLNGVYTDSFLWQDQNIRPDTSASGGVAFDIPTLALDEINEEGNGAILVLNFGDEGNARGAAQVGLLRVPEVTPPADAEGTETTTTATTTTAPE